MYRTQTWALGQRGASDISFAIRVVLAIGFALSVGVAAIAPQAMAQSLRGQWQHCLTDVTGIYSGLVAIDTEGRARLAAMGPGNVIIQEGYVRLGGGKVEVIFTSHKAIRPYALDRFYWTIRANDALDCINRDAAGTVSEPFVFCRAEGTFAPPTSNTTHCGRPSV